MKKVLFIVMMLLLLLPAIVTGQKAPEWAVELSEEIKGYEFFNQGKYLFFTNGKYVWCYDSPSGTEVWSMEVNGFENEGISYLLGEMYLTNSDNKLQAYDALTGKPMWENEYNDIDQADYMSFEFIKNNAVFRYGDLEVGIDLNNGKELFRMQVDYWGELVNLGTFNYSVLESQNRMLVMEDSEIASLFDITNGNKVFSAENFDANEDLIKNGLPWMYTSADEKYIVFVLNNGAAVIDVENNKEFGRLEFGINGDLNAILPTAFGCAIMGDEKFVHFNFTSGKISELEFPIDDIRTMKSYEISGHNVLVVSMGDKMAGVDLVEGKVLWQTANDDPEFEGYAHRYFDPIGENILFTYNRARLVSTESGTYIYLMSMNGLTGKLNYKTTVLLSGTAMTDFNRGLAKIITGVFTSFVSVGSMGAGAGASNQAMDMVNEMMGYNNIGFDYATFMHNGNMIFFSKSHVVMYNPETRDEPGEGFVAVNPQTGEIVYKNYFSIGNGIKDEDYRDVDRTITDGDIIYVPGEERLLAFNLSTGEKIWEANEPDMVIMNLMLKDGVVYAKYGYEHNIVSLKEDDIKINTKGDQDPYGIAAYDATSGNRYWMTKIENDPDLFTPEFSLSNYYNPQTNYVYYCDGINLFAIKLGAKGGDYAWVLNLEQNGIGEIDIDDSYAINEKWIGSEPRTQSSSTYIGGGWSLVTTTTTGGLDVEESSKFLESAGSADLFSTYTSWGNIWGVSATKCLQVLFGTDQLLVYGPNSISMVEASNGSVQWSKPWEYSSGDVQYVPKIINGSIIYCLGEELVCVDLNSGNEMWKAEESDKVKFFISPDEKQFFSLYEEEIKGYSTH